MTQEQKDLLLRDLCARLPYGVWIERKLKSCKFGAKCMVKAHDINAIERGRCDFYKPYLFPLSSMTEEQCYDFYCRFIENEIDYDDFKKFYFENNEWHKLLTSIDDCDGVVDWFNKNHFDYRGLIPMGLAIDATGLNIY